MPVCGPTGRGGAGTWQYQGLPISSAIEAGWGDPGMGSMAMLEQVLRGVKRLRAEEGKQKRQNDTGSNGGAQNQLE